MSENAKVYRVGTNVVDTQFHSCTRGNSCTHCL